MADYYTTQFCSSLDLHTPEEHQWWAQVFAVDWELLKSKISAPIPVGPGVKKVILDASINGVDEWPFEYELHKSSICFYDGYSFDELLELVHYFFKEMRPEGDDTFVLFWADTCSKTYLNAFQGGTAVVTKKGIGWCCPDDQMTMAMNNIKEVE